MQDATREAGTLTRGVPDGVREMADPHAAPMEDVSHDEPVLALEDLRVLVPRAQRLTRCRRSADDAPLTGFCHARIERRLGGLEVQLSALEGARCAGELEGDR